MKALTFHGIEDVHYESVPDPTLVDPGDVLLEVRMAAICGSDLHVYHGREVGLDVGTVMGHELVGEVVETGDEVRHRSVGEVVVAPFTTSCGQCFYCSSGLTSRCVRGQLFGWVEKGTGLHGGQAELVRVPLADTTLVPVPHEALMEEALLAGDVLSTGFFGAELAGVEPGALVAVVGCGPVGLMGILGARELGAERVFALDTISERLALAESFGAEPLNPQNTDAVSVLREATDGRGADGIIEAVGSPEATRSAIDLVRPGGTIAALGVHTEEHLAFTPGEAYDKNLTYRAGRCPVRNLMNQVMPLVAERRYDLSAIFSHRLPLDDGPRGYEIFTRKLDGCTKVLLTP